MRRLYYSDDEFGQAFRDALGNHREVPPSGNWKKINARLDKRRYRRTTGWIGASMAVLAVMVLGLSINISTKTARDRNAVIREQNERVHNAAKTPAAAPNSSASTKPPVAAFHGTTAASNNLPSTAGFTSAVVNKQHSSRTSFATDQRPDLPVLNEVPDALNNSIEAFQLPDYIALSDSDVAAFDNTELPGEANKDGDAVGDGLINEVAKPEYVGTPNQSSAKCRKVYTGIAVQPQHNTFLSQSAWNDDRMTYKFSPGFAFGITAGFNVCSRWAVETGVLYSQENQYYEFTRPQSKRTIAAPGGDPVHINLTYARVPVLVKYKMPWNARPVCESSVNVLAGLQYGRFVNGVSTGIKEFPLTADDIRKHELQLIAGVERSQPLCGHLGLNYGFRFGYGLNDMTSGTSQRINTLYKPHNAVAAVHVGVMLR